MNAGRNNSSLTPKKSAKAASSYACRLCGVNFKISVGGFGDRTSIFRPERVGVKNNSPSRPFENTSWCWTRSTSSKIFLWTLALNSMQSSKTRSRQTIKIKTLWNFSEIDAILAWATKWWMPLSVTQVVNALLCSDELCCPLHQSGVAVAVATKGPDTRCNIARNGWIASYVHPKICCTEYCSSRISSYFCNIARNKFLHVSTICSILCNSVTQISVFSQSNLTFKFNRWPNFRPWYVSRKRMLWSAEEESSLIDYYRGK